MRASQISRRAMLGLSGAFLLSATVTQAKPSHFPFVIEAKGNFVEPTAMAFLPETGARMNDCMLVAERAGKLKLWCRDGSVNVSGVPLVSKSDQGGLIDVIADPEYETNRLIYLTWVEARPNIHQRGSVVGRAKLVNEEPAHDGVHLEGLTILWRQASRAEDVEHFGTRIAFGPDGHLFIGSGDRFDIAASRDIAQNLGKIIRLTADGRPAGAFYPEGEVKASVWTLGHGNPAGLAFEASGRLWEVEGRSTSEDALLPIGRGNNYRPPDKIMRCKVPRRCVPKWPLYGWPKMTWHPPIQPTSMIIYGGALFPAWRGNALITGLSANSLIRIKLAGGTADRAESFKFDLPIRAVAEGPDGAVWLLEDKGRGRLFKLTPR